MSLSEFLNNLKSIVSIHDASIDLDMENVETLPHPKNFFLILHANKHINIDKYIEHEITPLGLEFRFHDKNEYTFLIKTDDWGLEDPPLYYHKLPYLKSSSVFLLTELAAWYATISPNVYSFKHLMISSKIRNLSERIIFEDNYEKNLRINNRLGVFVVVKSSNSYTIVARDKISLDEVLNNLGLFTETKKDEKTYHSDIISDGKISDNELNGRIKLVDLVDISIVSKEKHISASSFDVIINKWNKLLCSISGTNYEGLKVEISKEMTETAFSQSSLDCETLKTESQKLCKDLKIKKVILTIDSMVLLFEAKKEYPDGLIRAILKRDGRLDACFFE